MRSRLKLGLFVTVIGLCLALVALLVVNKLSIGMTSRVFSDEAMPIPLLATPADPARGAHLVRSVLGCMDCHGNDLAGKTLVQDPLVGSISAANLTDPKLTGEGYNRAIRYGLREDGRGLWLMPTEAYAALSDADLAAVIAYLKTLAPIPREMPANRLDLGGRWRVATGELDLVQAGAPRPAHPPAAPGPTALYGAYLAQVARCTGCHGAHRRGQGTPAPPDLTAPTGSLATWQEADFFRAMRDGRRPDGSVLAPTMPRTYATMTDTELSALWAHLHDETLAQ